VCVCVLILLTYPITSTHPCRQGLLPGGAAAAPPGGAAAEGAEGEAIYDSDGLPVWGAGELQLQRGRRKKIKKIIPTCVADGYERTDGEEQDRSNASNI
jgi:hypothetical protein